jgi:uncharacterized phage protein (TIGR02218 family)
MYTFQQLRVVHPNGNSYLFSSNSESSDVDIKGALKPVSVEIVRTLEENTIELEIGLDELDVAMRDGLSDSLVFQKMHCELSLLIDGNTRTLLRGQISEVTFSDTSAKIKVSSYLAKLGYGNVYRLGRSCRKIFGSSECGFNNGFTVTAINNISLNRQVISVSNSFPDNTFRNGKIEIALGSVYNISVDIATSFTDTLYLFEPLPKGIITGAVIRLYLGCNKDEAACKSYLNFENFGGVPESSNFFPGSNFYMASTKNIRT